MEFLARIKELTRPTGEEDLLNVKYPPPRIQVAPKYAISAVVLVFLAVGGWAITRPPSHSESVPQWESTATEAESSGQIVVSVIGQVENQGLVTLQDGARIADAVNVARPTGDADIYQLNQAQLLVDGQQILVPSKGAPPVPHELGAGGAQSGGAPPAGGAGGLVSLNFATTEELTSLSGVGDATAAAIVAHRESNGPFAKLEDLMDVKGIGPAKFDALKDQIML